jgi:hypothetical protein
MQRGSRKRIRKVLILSANPTGTLPLRLDKEIRHIRSKLIQSEQRSLFEIKEALAFTISDLLQLLEEYHPAVVHFCGHGIPEGFVCDDDTNKMRLIPTNALANLLKQYSGVVRCVILNACSSEPQAEELVKHIDYVVGVKGTISDNAALAYVKGFYTALFAGKDFPDCHELGKASIQLENIPEHSTLILRIKQPVKPTNEHILHLSKKKRDSSKSKSTKVLLKTDEQPQAHGRRTFLRHSMGAFAGSVGGWSLRASLEPKYPLDGFYVQKASSFPTESVKDTGLTVEAFYCTVAISHDSNGYLIAETTYNRLILDRLKIVIAGYVIVRNWKEFARHDSNVVTTSPNAERHILDELQFKGFAPNDADVEAFEKAKNLLKTKYLYRRASWEWVNDQLKKVDLDNILADQFFSRQ